MDCSLQGLADERDRELTQTWQQLRELQSEFRQLQLDSESQATALKEAQQVRHYIIRSSHLFTSARPGGHGQDSRTHMYKTG